MAAVGYLSCRSQRQVLERGKWRQHQREPDRATTVHLRVPRPLQDGDQGAQRLLHPRRAERHYECYEHRVRPEQNGHVGVLGPTPRSLVATTYRLAHKTAAFMLYGQFTPTTPTRLNATVESCRRRRCELGTMQIFSSVMVSIIPAVCGHFEHFD